MFQFLIGDYDEVLRIFEDCRITTIENSADRNSAENRGLALELSFDDPSLTELPWELMCRKHGEFLLTFPESSIVRLFPGRELSSTPIDPPLNVLVLMACPARMKDTHDGNQWHSLAGIDTYSIFAELQRIQEQSTRNGFPIKFDCHTQVSQSSLSTLLNHNYQVLYFIGHGHWSEHQGKSYLLLEDGTKIRNAVPLYFDRLNQKLSNSSIRMVVLNSCNSARHSPTLEFRHSAQVLLDGTSISAVVGMQSDVATTTAAAFDMAFFRELAQWSPVETCVASGRQAIIELLTEELDSPFQRCADWAIPIVLRKTDSRPLDNPFARVAPAEYSVGVCETRIEIHPDFKYSCCRKHEFVRIRKAFEIMRWPVTNLEYSRFLEDTGYKSPPHWRSVGPTYMWPVEKEGPNHPVICISYHDACKYCAWAKLDLPSDDELEIAFRAGGLDDFPWGNAYHGDHCNTVESKIGKSTSVFQFPAGKNDWGLWDTRGNVYEWTKTRMSGDYVIIGGSSYHPVHFALPFIRSRVIPTEKSPAIGFRCVRR